MVNSKKLLRLVLVAGVFAVLALIAHGYSSSFPDPDSFYHIRHTWLYRTSGLFQTQFPWVQYSAINQYASDIWYGFHIITLPFSYFKNLIAGIETGGIVITIISLLLIYWALARLKIKWPLFWSLLFVLISADVLYRMTMFRPHPLSIGLTLLLFSFLQETKNSPNNNWGTVSLFLISALFSWIHLALSWIPILTLLVVNFVRLIQKLAIQWKNILAMTSGILAGLILRPNFIGAAKLAYIQVVQLALEKNLPLKFGRELTPFVWQNFVDQLIPISLLILFGLLFLIWTISKKKFSSEKNDLTMILSSLILCLIFFALTFTVARRSNEFFVGFGAIFAGHIFTQYSRLTEPERRTLSKSWQANAVWILIILALIYAPLKTLQRFNTYMTNAFNPETLRESALWLKNNTQPKEIVFNIHWDRFGNFFFWNQKNYYINGMDPIFEYAYNPSLYWKNHFLHIDKLFLENGIAYICGEIRCTQDKVEDVYDVLTKDFKASYIVLEKNRNPQLRKYLENASGFKNVFETSNEIIFKILPRIAG